MGVGVRVGVGVKVAGIGVFVGVGVRVLVGVGVAVSVGVGVLVGVEVGVGVKVKVGVMVGVGVGVGGRRLIGGRRTARSLAGRPPKMRTISPTPKTSPTKKENHPHSKNPAPAPSSAPQEGQSRRPAFVFFPQAGHLTIFSLFIRAPHCGQIRRPGATSAPHRSQVICHPSLIGHRLTQIFTVFFNVHLFPIL